MLKYCFKNHLKVTVASLLVLASTASSAVEPTLLSNAELKQVSKVRENALNSHLGYEILESLTTEVGPRMAGSIQDPMAVEWAVKKFKSLGFDKVWKEEVTYDTWIRGVETASVVSPYPQGLHITALGGSVSTSKKGLTADIVHFTHLDKLIEADESEVKGKIVFISNKMERFRNGKGYGVAVGARSKGAVEASKKGALAIVIRSIGTDSHRVPHTGMMRYDDKITKIPAAALSNPDADQLVRILKRNQVVSLHLNIGSHPAKPFTSHNVIGEITGSTKPDELIIIGGHLDSWDLGTGAVDDGAGVALTMAAATLIKNSGVKNKRTIRVVLWANEEQGLLGAKAYAVAHKKNLKQHIIGAESDFGAGKIYQFSSLVKDKDLPFMDQIAAMLKPLGIEQGDNKATPGPDLIPMYGLGMSVFRLSQDGIDYFDLHHTADDTIDKVDPKSLAQNVAAYAVFALMVAQYEGDLTRPKSSFTKK